MVAVSRTTTPSATRCRGRVRFFDGFPGCSSLALLDPGLMAAIPAGIRNRSIAQGFRHQHAPLFFSELRIFQQGLEWCMGALEFSMGARESSMGALESSTGALESSTGALESSTGALESSMGALESSMGALESSMGARESSMGAREASMGWWFPTLTHAHPRSSTYFHSPL